MITNNGVDALDSEQKAVLLRWFFYHLGMEDRYKLMRELPVCYNQWAGDKIVKVVRVDGTPV